MHGNRHVPLYGHIKLAAEQLKLFFPVVGLPVVVQPYLPQRNAFGMLQVFAQCGHIALRICLREFGVNAEGKVYAGVFFRKGRGDRKILRVAGYLYYFAYTPGGKGGKRPKGIEIVTINSIDQLPRALFVE